jgi:hypothetical protein
LLDWNAPGIDRNDLDGGRGLRGLAFDKDRVYVTAGNSLLEFTPAFELCEVYRSPYLSQASGLACFDRRLYVTSKAYNSILGFDLDDKRFGWGLHIGEVSGGLQGMPFDPQSTMGPPPGDELGLNSIWCDPRGVFISGTGTEGLLHFDGSHINRLVSLPRGVENARPWRDGVLFTDSEAKVARFITPQGNSVFQLPRYPDGELLESPVQQGFARGLCVIDDSVFAVGSSPASVTLHNLDTMKTTRNINFSLDPGHTIHSLALWPGKP